MLNILLADDNELEREGIKFLLKKNGISANFSEASDGVEALAKIKTTFYHILITDIKMPLLNGVDLVRQVRDFNPNIHIIVISGYSDFEYARSLLSYDVLDYLIKPIDFKSLLNIIQKISSSSSENQNSEEQSIQKAIDIIQREFQKDLTLEEIAGRVFLSPSYFSKRFKEITGWNYTKYLTRVRMTHAESFLKNSNMKVAQIATYVGINNVSYFNRMFKGYYGYTPLEYRNRSLNNVEEV